jgi:hypothetical protein
VIWLAFVAIVFLLIAVIGQANRIAQLEKSAEVTTRALIIQGDAVNGIIQLARSQRTLTAIERSNDAWRDSASKH